MAADPAILFVKPKAISAKDKKALSAAGVVVIEVENPTEVKFTRAHAELSSTELLTAAARAIAEAGSSTGSARHLFGVAVCAAIEARHGGKVGV